MSYIAHTNLLAVVCVGNDVPSPLFLIVPFSKKAQMLLSE